MKQACKMEERFKEGIIDYLTYSDINADECGRYFLSYDDERMHEEVFDKVYFSMATELEQDDEEDYFRVFEESKKWLDSMDLEAIEYEILEEHFSEIEFREEVMRYR